MIRYSTRRSVVRFGIANALSLLGLAALSS